METGIVVCVAVVGGLIALMIAGIERMYSRRNNHRRVTYNRLNLTGRQPRIADNYKIGRAA